MITGVLSATRTPVAEALAGAAMLPAASGSTAVCVTVATGTWTGTATATAIGAPPVVVVITTPECGAMREERRLMQTNQPATHTPPQPAQQMRKNMIHSTNPTILASNDRSSSPSSSLHESTIEVGVTKGKSISSVLSAPAEQMQVPE